MNVPYGYQRLRLNLSADYGCRDSSGSPRGYDFRDLTGISRRSTKQTEDTGWGRVQWRPESIPGHRARGGVSRREIDDYDETLAASLEQNPLLRKYNLAYRYRQFGELSASASLPKLPVTIGARHSMRMTAIRAHSSG